jgi:hypothetical protein
MIWCFLFGNGSVCIVPPLPWGAGSRAVSFFSSRGGKPDGGGKPKRGDDKGEGERVRGAVVMMVMVVVMMMVVMMVVVVVVMMLMNIE